MALSIMTESRTIIAEALISPSEIELLKELNPELATALSTVQLPT
jgi:hypothetical protein